MNRVGRVRAADPESAELADVAIAGLQILAFSWRVFEDCPHVADRFDRICIAIAAADPVADLLTAVEAAHGLRDLAKRFPDDVDPQLLDVATRIDARAWARVRARLGIPNV